MNLSGRISWKILAGGIAAVTLLMLTAGFALYREAGYSAEPIWIFDSDLNVRNVETADLNGDGTRDIIAGEYDMNYYGEPSRVYALDGKTGDTIWTYLLLDGVRSMTIGDLNNDNVMDAVAGASEGTPPSDGKIHAINGVDGSSLWAYDVGATVQTVTVADLNGDDYMDVAGGSFDDTVYAINGQTGAILWKKEVDGMWINAVDGGDVNSDNIDDVGYASEYLAGYDNHFGVIDGATGAFVWDSINGFVVVDVLIENIDDDGQLEATFGVIYGDDHGEIQVRNATDGALEWSYDLGSMNHTNGNILLYAEDLNEDGPLELIVATYLGDHRILAFDGSSPTTMWISDATVANTRDLAFGDVLGDKDMNVVSAGGDRIEVLNGLDGSFIYYYSVNGSMWSASCADFDSDETLDIAAGGGSDFTGTPPNPDKGVWALKTAISPVLWEHDVVEYGNAIALGDFNGDSCLDVVAVRSLGDNATAIDGVTGDQIWVWQGTENLYAAAAGDFNNDGYDDAAVAGADDIVTAINFRDSSVMWQFTMATDDYYRKSLQAADLNGDDNVDVIAGAENNMVYAIRGENGDPLWSQNVGGEVNEVDLAQMNNDGPLDVVVATGGGAAGERVFVLNGADGSILWQYVAPEDVAHVEAMDVNDDGVMDVAAGVTPFSRQVIMIDGATQTSIWTLPINVESNIQEMGGGDLNGDKTPDVLVPANDGVLGDGVFAFSGDNGQPLWQFLTGAEVNDCEIYDIDNDGENEAVIGSDDQNVYVLNGFDGTVEWSFSTADDVMDIRIGDVNCNERVNIVCITFGSDGIVYAFRTLDETPHAICGDANGDGEANVADAVYLIAYIFKFGPPPEPLCAGDANGDGDVNVADAVYLISYVFKGGPPPVEGCCQ
jgi:outer membrane protein assembly factor BamB